MSRERVDAVISRVCRAHLGDSKAARARYFEEVHQELAPLARGLEKDIQDMKTTAELVWKEKLKAIDLQQQFYQDLLVITYDKNLKPAERLQALAAVIEHKLKPEKLDRFRNKSLPLLAAE